MVKEGSNNLVAIGDLVDEGLVIYRLSSLCIRMFNLKKSSVTENKIRTSMAIF